VSAGNRWRRLTFAGRGMACEPTGVLCREYGVTPVVQPSGADQAVVALGNADG
jgi:hypothetical protein